MREYITDHTVANAIRMKRSVVAGSFMVVEGVSDKLVYELVIDRETCAIEIAHGRENALGAIRILNAAGVAGIVAIVDADTAKITEEQIPEGNVFRTDLHDLECMMLNSPAFDRVLREFGSCERVAVFAAKSLPIARQLAMNAAPLGCLRLISLRTRLELKFKGLTFSQFVSAIDLKLDVVEMIRRVCNNSQKHDVDVAQLATLVSAEEEKGYDCWQISCGHDIVEILSVAFRKTFSGKSTGDVAAASLERSLRLAYSAEHLRKTRLYQSIADWEHGNPTFSVLDRTGTLKERSRF